MQIVLARCLRKFTKALIIIKRTNSEADSYIKKKKSAAYVRVGRRPRLYAVGKTYLIRADRPSRTKSGCVRAIVPTVRN